MIFKNNECLTFNELPLIQLIKISQIKTIVCYSDNYMIFKNINRILE